MIKKISSKTINEVGNHYGHWQVIERLKSDKHGFAKFLCKCTNLINNPEDQCSTNKFICNRQAAVKGSALRSGKSRSCKKCAHQIAGKNIYDINSINLVGKIFGRLTVIERLIEHGTGRRRWRCICSCPSKKVTIVRQEALLGKGVKPIESCGCLQHEAVIGNTFNKTHGLSNHPLHYIWCNIKDRCESPKCPAFKRYGGRGIKLCPEWQSFINFYNWAINNKWQQSLTVDRINNDGDYEPTNCQILPRIENILKMQRDKGRASFLDGKQINVHELSKKSGVPYLSSKKLINAGYSPKDVIQYSKLELFQRQAVGKSINKGNRINMLEASKIKRVVLNPKKQSSERGSYNAMLSRCYNSKDPSFKHYGAKEIKVCKAWKDNFQTFLKDMGSKPQPKHKFAIDRINKYDNYTPENCRWLSISENSKKRD